VIKGGSFYSKPEFLRPSAREHLSSGEKRAYDIGFRLVITGED
jgi:formylglycine-generating enzyme required for sulfatase activity